MSHTIGNSTTSSKPSSQTNGVSTGQPVDLKTLSKHLGLSKGTISRALNGYPEIAESTRARVMQAATDLGYKPNKAARRLATGRNELVSYIGVGADWMTVERSFLAALSTTLIGQGYGLLVSLADTLEHAEDTMRHLIEDRRVDGFVLSAAYPNDTRVDLAIEAGFPAAQMGGPKSRTSHTTPIPTIGMNDSAVLDGLVDQLNTLGHSGFAYFGCDAPPALQHLHSEMLAASCHNRNLNFQRHTRGDGFVFEPETASDLAARAGRLLDETAPTAVFCGCERTVAALYVAAQERGKRVPVQLSIIGIGSSDLASWLSGGLSTVSWSLSEAGRLAGECIVAQIEGREASSYATAIEAQFHARASHGPAPTAAH